MLCSAAVLQLGPLQGSLPARLCSDEPSAATRPVGWTDHQSIQVSVMCQNRNSVQYVIFGAAAYSIHDILAHAVLH